MLEDLEDMLIAADMGTDTALRVTANIAEGRMGRRISATELKQALADEVTRIMTPVARPLPLYAKKPQVVLVVGVRLGCINHARLTAAAIAADGLRCIGWIANEIDPQMERIEDNIRMLGQRLAMPCWGRIPWRPNAQAEGLAQHIRAALEALRSGTVVERVMDGGRRA